MLHTLRLQKHTLRICNIYCFFTATIVARTRLSVTFHVHCLSSWIHVCAPEENWQTKRMLMNMSHKLQTEQPLRLHQLEFELRSQSACLSLTSLPPSPYSSIILPSIVCLSFVGEGLSDDTMGG